ncbi:histidine--tRNA ligase [Tenuibacillus multivorans]|uniref:Histidine--tRNA ligase n=1 Tax=Tenuibacillus multivorans TaxID=237069 RepID=A0A1G9ZIG7_9BACI|nr:histidine--tRNA ligase [Tenuibacillus multivorans]GEL77487.1 histidine--tRNA ligase 2 [Tenuibacillus multivorans]SDN21119.1 histidyl-tRNA synthetase [Tenuibacillus multivorans]
MNIHVPRGTEDLLPETAKKWQAIEEQLIHLAQIYHYKEIRTPMFERTELFQRSVGDSTDIVQKEMYTFQDRGGRSLTLRPEGTASVARAYVQHKIHGSPEQPTKLYYMGPMFRYERPQQGRTRQFTQFGIEAIGSAHPAIDAEVMAFAMACYQSLGLKSLKLVINSLGDKESREAHRNALVDHFTPVKDELCQDCQNRLEQNPLRLLDCKVDRDHEAMKTAPSILDYLNEESSRYFEHVKKHLDAMGIDYVVDDTLVRGLDYYTHTAFEIMSEADGFGSITTLSGGGRYNGLIEELGGPDISGIGFALSIERLIMAIEAEGIELEYDETVDCYVIAIGEDAKYTASNVVYQLRKDGIKTDQDYLDKKMKGQFKAADRIGAAYVCIIGEDEVNQGVANVKNQQSGEQKTVQIKDISTEIKAGF